MHQKRQISNVRHIYMPSIGCAYATLRSWAHLTLHSLDILRVNPLFLKSINEFGSLHSTLEITVTTSLQLAVTVIVDTGRNSREPDDQLCKIERDAEEMKEMREKEMRERFKDIVGLSNLDAEIVKRRVAHLEQATDRVRSESQLEAGSQAISSRAAAYFALLLRPKRHYTGSMPLLLLLLLVSSTAVVQARKRGQEPEEPQGSLGETST